MKLNDRRSFLATTAMLLLAASGLRAEEKKVQGAPEPTLGEVRKVDTAARKITIKHGPIVNLDMPPMTMVFQVKEPALLAKVKAGDKVKFRAEDLGGALTVTMIEVAK